MGDEGTPRGSVPCNSSLGGSAGKRSHRERGGDKDDVDELVAIISSKLQNLDAFQSLESLVAVLVEVLNCSEKEAAFFLDSANNDVTTAVSLYLEDQCYSTRRPNNTAAPQHLPPTLLEYDTSFRRYRHMTLNIEGLPEDWEATVCPVTGVVLFEHTPTGTKQNQVPPGFADALPEPTSSFSRNIHESEKEVGVLGLETGSGIVQDKEDTDNMESDDIYCESL